MFDFLGEIGSGPRFVYMAFPWLLSKSYREDIRLEYRRRNRVLAWLEFSLAAFFLCFWLLVGFGVVLVGIKHV